MQKSRKNPAIDDHPSSADFTHSYPHQNIRRRTYIDRSSLASQSNEGRFKAKHWRKSWAPPIQPKKLKNPKGKSCICACCTTEAPLCCFPEELQVIDEDHEPEERLAKQCEQVRESLFGACDSYMQNNPCPAFNPTQVPSEEEVPYMEFFDIMRDTMEEAVKKSLVSVLQPLFTSFSEKIDNLAAQVQHNERILTKIYTDLNEKISYYGDRNAQQFQYLCMRMEHDRLFYQEQQEHFLKARNRTSAKSQKTDEEQGPYEDNSPHEDVYKSAADEEESTDDGRHIGKGLLESSKSKLRLPRSSESLRQNQSQISSTTSKGSLKR